MGTIAIVGLEQDASGAIDSRAADRLRTADAVIVPSATGAAAALVASLGITPVGFAELGLDERAPADAVVEALLEYSRDRTVALAVFGYPFVREGLMAGILARGRGGVDLYPVVSPLQVLLLALDLDATADLARDLMTWSVHASDAGLATGGAQPAEPSRRGAWRLQHPGALVTAFALFLLAVALGTGALLRGAARPPTPPVRLEIRLPEGHFLHEKLTAREFIYFVAGLYRVPSARVERRLAGTGGRCLRG